MKEVKLLNVLKDKKKPCICRVLAERLKVSDRTIRNYVKQINQKLGEEVIQASTKGYYLDKTLYEKCLYLYEDSRMQTVNGRINYLSGLLLKESEPVTTDALLAELEVSETTLQKDLRRLSDYFKTHNLQLVKKAGHYQLLGSEQQKRTLIRQIFSAETQDQMTAFYTNQDVLKEYEVTQLRAIVEKNINSAQLKMNEFALSNVILHLVVAIMRLKQRKYIESNESVNRHSESAEYLVSQAIFNALAIQHDFQVTIEEVEALRILLIGNTTSNEGDVVDAAMIKLTNEIVAQINQTYFLDFDNHAFIRRFSIHLNNLVVRRKKGIFNNNPMVEILKKQNLMMYDLGLFVANIIEAEIGIAVPDDEVAYLALHIGIFLEEESSNNLVSVAIVSPAYNEMEQRIVQNLEHYFQDQINIKEIITTYPDSTKEIEADIVISTISYIGTSEQEVIMLTPFFNMSDIKKVERSIAKIKLAKDVKYYQRMAHDYFDENFFYYDVIKESKEDYIAFLGHELVDAKIITSSYYESVLEREKMSSTSFNTVAMPHSLYRTAKQSIFAVLYNKAPIIWDVHQVDLVLFMAISQDDSDRFNDFLQLIIEIASDPIAVRAIVEQTHYEGFMTVITTLIQKKLESE
ncbi:BglG family transcription antiterminator [Brochothrix campestris]|uniref:Transcription antiterminator n=1 Tax=Brochothrix campestris FSL F6-1037 TaxID=1265861 RepID=W7CYC3_9LIST|nr:PTS sugar transporter subunit IIA [Brochothrix campestris]EUJ38018.1 transcription antiterminator [Brochothrix campestris FSL F6-1037]